jgi:Phosphotransferase enzyme family
MTTAQALTVVNRAHGRGFTCVRRLTTGEASQAVVVADASGSRMVFKWWPESSEGSECPAWLTAVVSQVERLRERGYPAPAYLLFGLAADVGFAVQQMLPGQPITRLRHAHVEALIGLNDLQSGAGSAEQGWSDFLVSTLLRGADGYCLHEPLRSHSDETARVLDRVVQIGGDSQGLTFPSGDAVHLDFHHLNLLGQANWITGVVDWEGTRSGDCFFDLVTLFYQSQEARLDQAGQYSLWDHLIAHRPRPVLRAYLAHMALRMVSWSILHHPDETTDRWLARSIECLDRCDNLG